VRLALAEKGIVVDITDTNPKHLPAEVLGFTLPVLIDRDLRLCEPRIIMEYVDERFPHPPLMPVDPVSRAQTRLYLHRVDQDWYRPVDKIVTGGVQAAASARRELRESLMVSIPIFEARPFFMSDELGLVDCAVVPILWRLSALGIELPLQARAIKQYATRMFLREAFRRSLSGLEEEMHVSVIL
jgi:RNA polymerase-associated protein